MDLVVDRTNGNRVFTFEDGKIKDQVWEPTPVTRFRFKNPVDNEWLRKHLAANYPTAGIVFKGVPYVGTSDGFVCTSDKKIQRIPEILVDEELFIDEFTFKDGEREAYTAYKGEDGLRKLLDEHPSLVDQIMTIENLRLQIDAQNRNLDRYLSPPEYGLARLAIRGFVVNRPHSRGGEHLYDGSLLGITETDTGDLVNDLIPHALYQVSPTVAGFVPSGYPPVELEKIAIVNGFERRTLVQCVDYRSLWSLNGQGIFVRNICPRDGSGYEPAKFATNGDIVAISHGDCGWYTLDILMKRSSGMFKEYKSLRLDSEKRPQKLFIRGGEVYGDSDNALMNFSKGNEGEVIFQHLSGHISSFSNSGNYTVDIGDGERTKFYNAFTGQLFADHKGEYRYLPATRQ